MVEKKQAAKIGGKDGQQMQKVQNQLFKEMSKKEAALDENDENAEDMLLAFDLLNKYKKDSKFIEKDIKSLKKKSDLVLRNDETEENHNLSKYAKKPTVDTILT